MNGFEIGIHAIELVGIGIGIWLTGQSGETIRSLADSLTALAGSCGSVSEATEKLAASYEAKRASDAIDTRVRTTAIDLLRIETQNGFRLLQEARKPGRKPKAEKKVRAAKAESSTPEAPAES